MKPTVFILGLALIAGCSSNPQSEEPETSNITQYYDLTAPEYRGKEMYWSVTKRTNPQFPVDAAKRKWSGCVEMEVLIDSYGQANRVKITNAYPEDVFDDVTMMALKNWRWEPTEENPERVPALVYLSINYQLTDPMNAEGFAENCHTVEPDALSEAHLLGTVELQL